MSQQSSEQSGGQSSRQAAEAWTILWARLGLGAAAVWLGVSQLHRPLQPIERFLV